MTRAAPLALLCLILAACGRGDEAEETAETAAPRPLEGTLEWALQGDWRAPEEMRRDSALHPVATFDLAGLGPGDTVVDMWPGGGWSTAVLAPYLAAGGGAYVAAARPRDGDAARALADRFAARFAEAVEEGALTRVEAGPTSGPLVRPGTADIVLAVDALHAWMAAGLAEKLLGDAFDALRPGGRLVIVQPRAADRGLQDPGAASGYVQESYVKRLAEEAGFTLAAKSEINANPFDAREHPFGVWTLAPWRLTAPLGEPANPDFDRAPYDIVGEPDRMTMVFRKPVPTPPDGEEEADADDAAAPDEADGETPQ